ncbi:hypothetical protein [Carnobacterium divergens]|uniref:hypothetical protein n=1 Tax=Carnobacterium divergens TaxID=2748 RepID=UPI0039B003BA
MNEISKYYRDPTPITEENWVEVIKISGKHKTLATWIREKMYGIDVREALARLVEQMSSDLYDDRQIAIALDKLAKELQEKWDSDTQKIIDEWKNTIGGVTVDSELINARIDLHGFVYKTLKKRLDDMQSKIENLDATESVFKLTHNQNCYPAVRAMYHENGLGVKPLGDAPLGGTNVKTIACEAEYLDKNSLTVKVPLRYKLSNCTVNRIASNQYLLVDGVRALTIEIGNENKANVETMMDFTTTMDFKNKVTGSVIENPSIAKWAHDSELLLPNSAKYKELTQVYYNQLNSDVFTVNATDADKRAMMLSDFNVLENFKRKFPSFTIGVNEFRSYVRAINVATYAKGSNSTGNKASFKVFVENAWVGSETNTTDQIKGLRYNQVNAPIAQKYIQNDGFVHSLVYAEPSDGKISSSLSNGYVSLEYKLEIPFAPLK